MTRLAKHEATGYLLLSMQDYLPDPKTSGSLIAAAPGPQASYYVPCLACHGSGRQVGDAPCIRCRDKKRKGDPITRPRHGCRLCLGCDGRGERRRRRGDEAYEAYSRMTFPQLEEDNSKRARSTAQKRTSAVLPASEATRDEIPWLASRERYRDAGSYTELHLALAWLADRFPLRYEMLHHWVSSVDDPLWSWSELALQRVDETIRLLAARMPEPVRVPSWVVRGLRDTGRDRLLPWMREAA